MENARLPPHLLESKIMDGELWKQLTTKIWNGTILDILKKINKNIINRYKGIYREGEWLIKRKTGGRAYIDFKIKHPVGRNDLAEGASSKNVENNFLEGIGDAFLDIWVDSDSRFLYREILSRSFLKLVDNDYFKGRTLQHSLRESKIAAPDDELFDITRKLCESDDCNELLSQITATRKKTNRFMNDYMLDYIKKKEMDWSSVLYEIVNNNEDIMMTDALFKFAPTKLMKKEMVLNFLFNVSGVNFHGNVGTRPWGEWKWLEESASGSRERIASLTGGSYGSDDVKNVQVDDDVGNMLWYNKDAVVMETTRSFYKKELFPLDFKCSFTCKLNNDELERGNPDKRILEFSKKKLRTKKCKEKYFTRKNKCFERKK